MKSHYIIKRLLSNRLSLEQAHRVFRSGAIKKIILVFFSVLFCIHTAKALEEKVTAEIINLKTENNNLLITVAKRYPEVRFSKFQNPNKILIELLGSKPHNKFKFDDSVKKDLLSQISFVTDLTAGTAKYENDKTKVSIILTLNEGFTPFPKIISTKENIIKISFNETKIQPIQEVKPQETLQEKAINQNVEAIKDLYNKAVEESINGNVEKSEGLYKELISKKNDFHLAKYNLAKMFFDRENYAQSEELLSPLIIDVEKEGLADKRLLLLSKNLLGLIYLAKDSYDKAQEQFNEIIKIDSNFYEAYYNLGITYEKTKDTEQAILNLKKTIELKPDYALAYYHLGILNLILKNKEEAISHLEKVFSLSPESNIGKLSENELKKLEKRKFKFHK